MASIDDVPSSLPVLMYSSAARTASLPIDTLSAPERKYAVATCDGQRQQKKTAPSKEYKEDRAETNSDIIEPKFYRVTRLNVGFPRMQP